MEENNKDTIDIIALLKTLWQRRKVFYWVLSATFVITAVMAFCIPQYYTVSVELAPEAQPSSTSGSLGALASTFGFDIGSMASEDAVRPRVYPKVVESQDFMLKLFPITVTTSDGSFSGTYYDYIMTRYKRPFWKEWKAQLSRLIHFYKKPNTGKPGRKSGELDPFWLTGAQCAAVGRMQEKIVCEYDKKMDIITISVTDNDKLVSATVADSVRGVLQDFMTDYRTYKSRVDMLYYEKVMLDAKAEYLQASQEYINYIDSHRDLSMQRYKAEAQNLESEMQLRYVAYSSFQKQYMTAQAKVQECTPVFKVIKSATVPGDPTGPRRLFFVMAMLILAFVVTASVIAVKQLKLFA